MDKLTTIGATFVEEEVGTYTSVKLIVNQDTGELHEIQDMFVSSSIGEAKAFLYYLKDTASVENILADDTNNTIMLHFFDENEELKFIYQ